MADPASIVLLSTVAPALGVVVALLMFSSPLKAILQLRKEGVLGDINPLPYPLIIANCGGWLAYSYITKDVFVYIPNQIGLLIGLFFTLTAYGFADAKVRDRLLYLVLFFAALLTATGFIGVKLSLPAPDLQLLWGYTANAILLIFYCSPLSTLLEVVQTRSSASLYLPLCTMAIINGSLWTAYGLAINDFFIWVPNAVGAVLGAVQVVLIWIFPSRPYKRVRNGDKAGSDKEVPIVSQLGA